MKNLILSLVMIFSSLVSFSQIYEVSFSEYVGFNTGDLNKYEDVIDSTNYVRSWDHFGSVNKYIVNLTNKTVERYYDGKLSKSTTIVTSKKVGDLIYLTINDEENFTGNKIVSNLVINTNKNNESYPDFVLYFLSTRTNTINGFVSM